MLAEISVLQDVQKLDKEALKLEQELKLYPTIWNEVKDKLGKRRAELQTAEANQEKHIKSRRNAEQSLRLLAEALRKYQAQQNAIKTPKEYEAANKQLEATRQKMQQEEERAIALLSKDESIENDVKAAKAAVAEIEGFAKVEKERIRIQFNEKKSRVAEIEAERKKLIAEVSQPLLIAYERANRAHPGEAIVAAHTIKQLKSPKGNNREVACGGCNYKLLSAVMNKLYKEKEVVNCPNCQRILSHDADYQEVVAG